MKKLLLPVIILFVTFVIPIDIFASSLEVSKSPSFSSLDLNFVGGETVYVRVKTDKVGTSSVLNVRDNQYNSINKINLNRNGEVYTASLSAPGEEGYYSLEAKIEGDGMNVTSVKTIKVGNPTSANVKVNVSSNVKGTKSENSEELESSDKSDKSEGSEIQNVGESDSRVEVYSAEDVPSKTSSEKSEGFFGMIVGVFRGAWNLFRFF